MSLPSPQNNLLRTQPQPRPTSVTAAATLGLVLGMVDLIVVTLLFVVPNLPTTNDDHGAAGDTGSSFYGLALLVALVFVIAGVLMILGAIRLLVTGRPALLLVGAVLAATLFLYVSIQTIQATAGAFYVLTALFSLLTTIVIIVLLGRAPAVQFFADQKTRRRP